MAEPDRILVRATVNLPGLNVGTYALIDPEDPYMEELLEGDLIVPEESDE